MSFTHNNNLISHLYDLKCVITNDHISFSNMFVIERNTMKPLIFMMRYRINIYQPMC